MNIKSKSLTVLAVLFLSTPLWAETPNTPDAVATATVVSASASISEVQIERSNAVLKLSSPAQLMAGDSIITAPQQTVKLDLKDGSQIMLTPQTHLTLSRVAGKDGVGGTETAIQHGIGHFVVAKVYKDSARFRVHTPAAVMGVRGTEFLAEETATGSTLNVLDGSVAMSSLKNPSAEVLVAAGKKSTLDKGKLVPSKPARINFKELEGYLATRSPEILKEARHHRQQREIAKTATKKASHRKHSKEQRFTPKQKRRRRAHAGS